EPLPLILPEGARETFAYLKNNVGPGQIITYRELAEELGINQRVITVALQYNPWPVVIPCHRVIRSDGKIGGYLRGHEEKKYWLLRLEGIRFKREPW
ncbi:MAG: methylated-DNA--[protein]-cysteine S-methyltransferase, partial [Candidatus Hydrothermia bacterium]